MQNLLASVAQTAQEHYAGTFTIFSVEGKYMGCYGVPDVNKLTAWLRFADKVHSLDLLLEGMVHHPEWFEIDQVIQNGLDTMEAWQQLENCEKCGQNFNNDDGVTWGVRICPECKNEESV
ncbi:MAG: hypothetical protein KF852_04260 [Saprospiraceae bacterium]|nr:hypothetical protein [Saprospiraceae bacterium]